VHKLHPFYERFLDAVCADKRNLGAIADSLHMSRASIGPELEYAAGKLGLVTVETLRKEWPTIKASEAYRGSSSDIIGHDVVLSPRERFVVNLVVKGHTNKEMAEEMFISEQTVKNHLHNIFDKTGVTTRYQLAAWGEDRGYGTTEEAETAVLPVSESVGNRPEATVM
jgi:DNA-binding CsgD family transcriptional regulator